MGALASPKLGDLRFAPKLVLRQGADRVGVALMVGFTLPSSGSSAYAGDRGATFDPELILSRAWGGFRLAGNVGYLARKTETLMDLQVDDELYARIGAGYRFASRPLEIDATTGISTAAAKPFAQINTDPWELDLAAQYDVRRDVTLFALGGMGIGAGFGSPDYRIVLGLRFTRTPPIGPRDTDGDGIIDELDKCPTEPEDRDGFEDADGCPDPDNDKDGIPDVADRCPNEPEDKDGFEDADGCPDPDNDKDGIPDTEDRCPNEPEDKDGFEDTDGCPDPDNDKDGIPDTEDKCPNEPGPAINQGCPDVDRDGDGVPDRIDNCPDEPGPVENHGCAQKQLVTITNGKLELVDRVYFRTDKDIIETRSNAILDNVAKVLLAHPEIAKVRVEGHTDNRGGAKHNQDLSQRRAAAVVKYLVGKKVARDRLDPAGFGQDRPIADNDSDTGRATNRRVEFVIVGDGVETKATGPDAGTIGK
jgi:outer membrane protein OmpA-like peptidoglycan-associated protein